MITSRWNYDTHTCIKITFLLNLPTELFSWYISSDYLTGNKTIIRINAGTGGEGTETIKTY